jgi:DNA polymerase-1
MLRRLVEDGKPDYFAVVFDAPGKTFRDDWYPEYKAHRTPMPDDLVAQIAPLHEVIRAHGWPLLVIKGVEADDVIGTLAREAAKGGVASLISTGDKDLAQLVTPEVTLVNTMSNETLDEAGVKAKFDVRADQVLDLLTLTGDTVDNVPGVPKVGPKTAAKWLAAYGSLDNLMAHAEEVGGVVGENLRATLQWLPEARKLLTVKTDCELPVALRDLQLRSPDAEALRKLYERFEFKAWVKDIEKSPATTPSESVSEQAPDDAAAPPRERAPAARPREHETVLDEKAFERWMAAIETAPLVCIGTETTSLDPMRARIIGLSFALEDGRAAYIPLVHSYAGAPPQLPLERVLGRLKPWFEKSAARKVGQNLKYHQHVLANHGIALAGVAHDTLLESYVLESHRPHDMASLALRHLDLSPTSYTDLTGRGAAQIGFDQVAIDRAGAYAAEEADLALRVHGVLYPRLKGDAKLAYVYETIELPTRSVLYRMERNGVLLDPALLATQGRVLAERLVALEQQAYQLAGGPFNPASPKQLGEILFERMKLPVIKKTSTGQPSTDEDVLQELAANYPLPKLLLEHRALSKLKSTYTDKLPQMVNRETGRVHTSFGQATAVTGRLASTDPNLQNIPVRTAEGRRIREAFVAPPGHVLVSADYSQIELRIMAHLSDDASLLGAFAEGADIHRATAAEIFGVSMDEVTSEQRRYIKAVNFGLIYGMSAFGLAAQLNIERAAAQQFIDRYFTRYPGVAEYMRRTRELAHAQGYVETVFGRRLWLPDINAGGGPRRQAAERAAINAPMQGTAADLIKLAMIAVQDWLDHEHRASRLILQVHDELVLEVPAAELPEIKARVPQLMTSVASLKAPLVVDLGAGPNWEQAH